MKPRVSVIIATYNFGKFLPETVESVFRQSFSDWELIIVDDGSTDHTRDVVMPYLLDKRVRYIFQRNMGLPAARNVGISACSGEYIQFLDADDLIHPNKLEIQSECFGFQKNADVVFSDYSFFKDGKRETLINPPFRKLSGDIKADMLKGNFIVVNSPLSKKKAIDRVGGFDETLTSTEDWDLWLRMLLSGMVFEKIDERLAFVRIHQERMTGNRLNMYSGRYQVIKKNLKDVPRKSIYWQSAIRCFVRSKLALMRENLYRGKIYEAFKTVIDNPHHISFLGVLDFMLETMLSKNTS